jgi:hypothetical protein
VISFPGTELKSRDVVVGLTLGGSARAYPWDALVKQSPVVDRVHDTPLLVAVGPDGKSFRVFVSRIDDKDAEFFLKGESEGETTGTAKMDPPIKSAPPAESKAGAESSASASAKPAPAAATKPWILLDTATASEWDFQGCAISGASQGKCLERVPALKDYWFDWRNYHPDTTIYKR